MLKVGIAEVDITPAPGLPRAGMPNPQKGQGTAWSLMGRIFVFDDGIQKAAIVALDLLFLNPQTVAEYRQAMTAGTGLAPTDVMITCTHTHWGPHTTAIMDTDADFAYIDFVRVRLVECMARALASLRPASLKVGCVEAPGWAFNRRQVYNTPLGEQVGTQGPQWIDSFLRLEGPDDPQLRLLLVEEDGKPAGGLVNFTCHTTVGPDEPLYSSDYPGPLTERLARELGGVYGFLQGCAGNIWQMDMSKPQVPGQVQAGSAHTLRMGEALGGKAEEAAASARPVADPRVRIARKVLRIPQRRPTPDQVERAKWFLEKRPADADLQEHMRKMYGHEYTFYRDPSKLDQPNEREWMIWQEDWFARGTLGVWEAQRRAGTREIVEDVEVQAIAIGDVAFVGYPAEYFSEFGLKTKANSPFPDTFVSELTNGWHGYVPTLEGFAHGGYEARLGDASRLVPEAGDLICDTGIALLKELWHD
jgi:neutral ceramidase